MRRTIHVRLLAALVMLCAVAVAGCGKPAPAPQQAPPDLGPQSEPPPLQGERIAAVASPEKEVPASESPDESSSEYQVILTGFGESKIQVIKVVREATGMGLKEAKDFVEGPPAALKTGLSKADAEKLMSTIEAAGGAAQIEPAAKPTP